MSFCLNYPNLEDMMMRLLTYHQDGHFPGIQSEVLQKGVYKGRKGVAHKKEV